MSQRGAASEGDRKRHKGGTAAATCTAPESTTGSKAGCGSAGRGGPRGRGVGGGKAGGGGDIRTFFGGKPSGA